jgi:asparagine synthase (glutamine-hydrolysing)
MLRGDALRKLIHDEHTGQQDHAKQIWQLLSLELWYRNAQAMGVATR